MRDPVVASDGFTYERTAIEKWLAIRDSSPMSNAPLPMKVRVSAVQHISQGRCKHSLCGT